MFFFNDSATTEIYTLSLHDALPISVWMCRSTLTPLARETDPRLALTSREDRGQYCDERPGEDRLLLGHIRLRPAVDRKSTRLNSSHANISYAVFCLKKKIKTLSRLL